MHFSDALESKWEARRKWKKFYEDGLMFKAGIRPEHRGLIIEQTRRSIGALAAADPYFWSPTISAAVADSSTRLPLDTTLKAGRDKPEWWYFASPVSFEGFSDFKSGSADIQAVLLTPMDFLRNGGRWMEVIPFDRRLISTRSILFDVGNMGTIGSVLDSAKGKPSVEMIAPGTSAPSANNTASFLQFYVASQLWLEQEIIRVDSVQAERHYRKRLLSAGVEPQPISVVQLRRVARQEAPQTEHEAVEWSCQWIVRGHWRQQFYPSSNERRPLWIMPYVKGPEDAPLKTPSPTVFAVTR